MTDKIDVTLAHPHQGKKPGDKLSVERGNAKQLIRAGIAVPANTAAAKAVDGDTTKK